MSCPGPSLLTCRSCEHEDYCDIKIVCRGNCRYDCEDVECDNHPVNGFSGDVCSECGKEIVDDHDVRAFSIGRMCVDCLMANSEECVEEDP